MKHLRKFNESEEYCDYCNGEGREPYCPFCNKPLDYSGQEKEDWSEDENEYPEELDNNFSDLEYKIRDIIEGELFLRDVPYSRVDGDKEVAPESLDEAAKRVIELLKKEGLI